MISPPSSLPTLDKEYNLIGHLKANKTKFSWLGSFEQLLQFAEEQDKTRQDDLFNSAQFHITYKRL